MKSADVESADVETQAFVVCGHEGCGYSKSVFSRNGVTTYN